MNHHDDTHGHAQPVTGPGTFAHLAANVAPIYQAARAEVARSIIEDNGQGTADPHELYAAAHADGGHEWATYCDVAGLALRDLVTGWADELADATTPSGPDTAPAFLVTVLRDVLDLGNRGAWAGVAETFMPAPDDVAAAPNG